jgi:putative transposase
MSKCEDAVLAACSQAATQTYAWCVLPNHYHLLVRTDDLKSLTKALGQFHGRSSYAWNQEDDTRGRKVWHRAFDRAIRSDRHFWVTVNYIHHNPVHHGYVDKWQDWLWSSAKEFLELVGRDEASRMWREYPILDYGKKWDV